VEGPHDQIVNRSPANNCGYQEGRRTNEGEVLGLMRDAVDLDAVELAIDLQPTRVRRKLLLRETKTEACQWRPASSATGRRGPGAPRSRANRDQVEAKEAW